MCFMQDVHSFQPQRLVLPPNWRADPELSDTDMTLEVVRERSKTSDKFYVHQSVLTTKSRYFGDALGSNKDGAATPKHVDAAPAAALSVRFTLDDDVAAVVPDFLDFCYSLPSFRLERQNAMPLRFLANLLDIPSLRDLTWEFVKRDLRNALDRYLREAYYYEDSQVSTWVAYEVAELAGELDPSSDLWAVMLPDDFATAASLALQCETCDPEHLERLAEAHRRGGGAE